MKTKVLVLAICSAVLLTQAVTAGPGVPVAGSPISELVPIETSAAFKKFLKRPQSELSKLIFLMDRFRDADVSVVYDGLEYTSNEALRIAKKQISKHYDRKSTAKKWVYHNAYRSDSGNIIYLKVSDDVQHVLRDVLVSELELLEKQI